MVGKLDMTEIEFRSHFSTFRFLKYLTPVRSLICLFEHSNRLSLVIWAQVVSSWPAALKHRPYWLCK